jgi:hypothetical protein
MFYSVRSYTASCTEIQTKGNIALKLRTELKLFIPLFRSLTFSVLFSLNLVLSRTNQRYFILGHLVSPLLTHEGSDYNADPTERVLAALTPYTRTPVGHVTKPVSRLQSVERHDR